MRLGRDILTEPLKEVYYNEAARYLNEAGSATTDVGDSDSTIVAFLSRGEGKAFLGFQVLTEYPRHSSAGTA